MNSSNPSRATALITGGSSGIGFELACRAAEDGRNIVLVARDPQRLEEAATRIRARYRVDVATYRADLATEEGVRIVTHNLPALHPEIDMVMNCAGIAYGGECHRNRTEHEVKVSRVNMEATLSISRAYAERFVEKGHGWLLNVSSLAAFQAGPYLANYYASKAYVLLLTEGLARELAPYGVRAAVLCPGTTGTGFHEKAGIAHTDLARGLFGIVMDPETVSRTGYRGLMSGKVVIVPGVVNRLAAFGVRLVPRGFSTLVTAWINRPKMAPDRASEKA